MSPSQATPKKLTIGGLTPFALIVLAGLWAYWPAFRGGWVWDDVEEVTQNAVLRDPAGLARIWTGSTGTDYFPLKTTVQWLVVRAAGESAPAFHAASVALHIANALLFCALLRRLGLRFAWAGGLLFAVHPLAVESVAWVSELKNTLSLFFLLQSMIAYIRFDGKGSGLGSCFTPEGGKQLPRPDLFYFLSLFLFVLAMLSKSSVVMLPFALLLHAWWRRGRIARADLAAAAPFFAVSLFLGAVTAWFQEHRAILPGHVLAGGALSRIACSGMALAFYAWKSVWPAGLMPIYPRWSVNPPSLFQFLPWLGIAVLFAWFWTRRAGWGRHAIFGLGFFAVNLLPVSGLIQMSYMHITWVADHFAYVSLLGAAGLAAAGLESCRPRFVALSTIAVVGAALAVLSHRYAAIFHDEQTLWTHALERNPQAWPAHHNLGDAYLNAGRFPEAIVEYKEALRLGPDFVPTHYSLGTALLRMNRVPEAIAEYEEALRLKPDWAEAHNNLGSVLASQGRMPEATAHLEEAVRLKPDYADARNNLGNAYLIAGRFPDAIAQYRTALGIDPDNSSVRRNLDVAVREAARRAAR